MMQNSSTFAATMKNKAMKNLLLLVIFLIATSAIGQSGEMKVVPQKNSDNFKIYFQADMSSSIVVEVRDARDKVVQSLKFKDKDGFILPLDFSEYNSGDYTVELQSPFFTLSEKVTFHSQIDQLKEKIETEVISDKRRILITLLEPIEGDLNLSISDADGNIVREEQIDGKQFGMRAFDFSDTTADVEITMYYEGQHLNTWIMGD